jgi:hypothetical protein
VILAGPQYPLRLWCVIEAFTFLSVGADVRRIVVLLLEDAAADAAVKVEAAQAVRQSFATFDVRNAECFAGDRNPVQRWH